jgi:hypothetical protein
VDESNFAVWWAFPVFFGGLWLILFLLIARWGGWDTLAAAYPSSGTPMGERFRMRSAQLRWGCSYNNCITFVSSQSGLHLSMPLPFRFGHPPIFIPWSELRAHEERTWFIPVVALTSARCPDIPIKLRKQLAIRILGPAGSQLSRAFAGQQGASAARASTPRDRVW